MQGGIGPAGLATEDLHVLDFTDTERPRWHRYDHRTLGHQHAHIEPQSQSVFVMSSLKSKSCSPFHVHIN